MTARSLILAVGVLALVAPGADLTAQVYASSNFTLHNQRFEWRLTTLNEAVARQNGTYGLVRVDMQAGVTYEIFTSNAVTGGGNTTDTFLYLTANSDSLPHAGAILAQDDNSGGNFQARIVHAAGWTGSAWVRLRARHAGTFGFGTLTVRPLSTLFSSGAIPLELGNPLENQRFEWRPAFGHRFGGSYGTYSVTLNSWERYTIETSAAVAEASGGMWPSNDPYLHLLNRFGEVLALDNDSAGTRNARIVFQPQLSGTYFVRLRCALQNFGGRCTLSLKKQKAPDLTVPAYFSTMWLSSSRRLNFSHEVSNFGPGAMELRKDSASQAWQRVYDDRGTSAETLVGRMIQPSSFLPHLERLEEYTIRYVYPSGEIGGLVSVLAQSGGFFLSDVYAALEYSGPVSASTYSLQAGGGIVQGISVGRAALDTQRLQEIDISILPDGTYCLEVTVDPDRKLFEANRYNNVRRVKFQVSGGTARIVP